MKIANVYIGQNPPESPMVEFTKSDGVTYLVNTITKQKIKLGEKLAEVSSTLKFEFEKNVKIESMGEKPLIQVSLTDFNNPKGDLKITPSVNNLSFNPYLYLVNDKEDFMEKELVLVNIGSDFKLLSYSTEDAEIINTVYNKNLHVNSCMVRFNTATPSSITIIGVMKTPEDKPRYIKMIIDGLETITTDTLDKAEYHEASKMAKKLRGKYTTFKYSARELPRTVLTSVSEYDAMSEYVKKLHIIKPNIIKVADDVDLSDIAVAKGILGDELRRTKGLLVSPNVKVPYAASRALGIYYLFKVFTDKDGEYHLNGR